MSDDNEGAVEAPKILGDVFESVAGAVFLDSGMDVVKTWKVYHRMMKPYIDFYSKHVPYNPIRKVHENDNDAKFRYVQKYTYGMLYDHEACIALRTDNDRLDGHALYILSNLSSSFI